MEVLLTEKNGFTISDVEIIGENDHRIVLKDEMFTRLCEELKAMPEEEAMRHIGGMDVSREEKRKLKDALRGESI